MISTLFAGSVCTPTNSAVNTNASGHTCDVSTFLVHVLIFDIVGFAPTPPIQPGLSPVFFHNAAYTATSCPTGNRKQSAKPCASCYKTCGPSLFQRTKIPVDLLSYACIMRPMKEK